jgi:hypothetical protein
MSSKIDQLMQSMDDVFNDLVVNSPRARLPEELFVSNFLPFFIGKGTVETNSDFLPTWISIAGSPAADVDVIDNRGNVLFTVPAFIDSGFINPLKNNSGLSYSDIVNMAILFGNNIPKQGAAVLSGELEIKINRLKDKSPDYAKKINMWEIIFKRYKITDKEISDKSIKVLSAPGVKLASNISDDDFE